MNKQNQIKSTLSQPEALEQIQSHLEQIENISRTQLSKELCRHFNFFDPKGDHQVAGCLKALRELEKEAVVRGKTGRVLAEFLIEFLVEFLVR